MRRRTAHVREEITILLNESEMDDRTDLFQQGNARHENIEGDCRINVLVHWGYDFTLAEFVGRWGTGQWIGGCIWLSTADQSIRIPGLSELSENEVSIEACQVFQALAEGLQVALATT